MFSATLFLELFYPWQIPLSYFQHVLPTTFASLTHQKTLRYQNILVVRDFYFYQKYGIQKQTHKTTNHIFNNLKALLHHQLHISISDRVYPSFCKARNQCTVVCGGGKRTICHRGWVYSLRGGGFPRFLSGFHGFHPFSEGQKLSDAQWL